MTGDVDVVSGASLVDTAPSGTDMTITRIDDKRIKLKVTGTASSHTASINRAEGSSKNQKDHNGNGIYGDIKFLMLPSFFTGVNSVEDEGHYVVMDVIYTDEQPVVTSILNQSKSGMTTVENVDYGVLVLNQGSKEDYNFSINGVTLNPTKVNDSGSVLKFEMNRNELALVKVVSKSSSDQEETISIANGTQAFTGVVEDQDPERILLSGGVSYFDYYLISYDESGQVRSELTKTTFDTENEGVKPVDTTVPQLTLNRERTPLGEDIVINVADPSSVKSKSWMANVYQVFKDFDRSENSRIPVQFSLDPDNDKVIIKGKSTAIDGLNGHHEVVIKSNGFNDISVNFELIKPAGQIDLSGNFNWWANNDLLFELKGFNYAITNPIHEVYLNDELLTGDCTDYHVVSNLVRLENGALSKLPVGEHTLKIKIHGYEDFTKTFILEPAPNGSENPKHGSPEEESDSVASSGMTVDVVSAASGFVGGGSGSGSGEGSSGATGVIRANVVIDFDQFVNASILQSREMNTTYSDKVIEWWSALTKDAIIKEGSDVLVAYQYYKNNVGFNQEFSTYADLLNELPSENPTSGDKPLYLNRPYELKNMLHDGKLGENYRFREAVAKDSPSLTIEGDLEYGKDLVVRYSGDHADDWAENLTNVKSNHNYMKYTLDKEAKTLTFSGSNNSFVTGVNELVFNGAGYKTVRLSVTLNIKNPSNISLSRDSDNNVIVDGLDAGYLEELRGVYLGNQGLFNDSQVGGNGSYAINGDQIILRAMLFGRSADQFDVNQRHVLKIEAEGYADLKEGFTPSSLAGGSIELKQVPGYVELKGDSYRVNDDVLITVEQVADSSYGRAIQKIYVNNDLLIENQDYKTDTLDSYALNIKGSAL